MLKSFSARAAILAVALLSAACQGGGAPAEAPAAPSPTAQPTVPPAFGGHTSTASIPTLAPAKPQPTATSVVSATTSERQTTLRYKFAAGDTRVMTSTTHMTFDSTLAPAGQKMPPMTIEMAVRYDVLDVTSDGSANVRATFEQMDFTSGDGTKTSSELVGIAVRMLLHPDGTYNDAHVEVDGHEIDEPGVDAARMADMMIPFTYPSAPLHIGSTFQRDIRIALGNGMPETVARTRYTLADIATKNGVDTVQFKADASMTVPPPQSQPGVTFSGGTATISGSDYADSATGWPTKGDQVMTMSYHLQSADGRVSGTMSARSESTYTVE